jgi:hypothetical protein
MDQEVCVQKYSFHWQAMDGCLVKRWDNAAHHPEVLNYPHHVHNGAEVNVLPHEPVCTEAVLALVMQAAG